MTKQQVIENLELYNRWRLGEDIEQPEPNFITSLIESAIEHLKRDSIDMQNGRFAREFLS